MREIKTLETFEIKQYDVSKMRIQKELGATRKYPFDALKVGDGFEVPEMLRASAIGSANRYMKEKPETKFILCRDENNKPIFIRTA
jgi:hypothetical protein